MFVLNLCPLTYANVTPSSSFGNATEVKVGSVMTHGGGRVDLIVARNSTSTTANTFTGVSEYKPGQGTYYRKSETRANLRNIQGVRSAGTVNATIEHQVSKRAVTDEIMRKAKIAGRALGKGAAGLGRAAVSRHPLGLAFALALEGIAGSDIFWHEEKGDFVRADSDNTYIVVSTKDASGEFPDKLDDKSFDEVCANNRCQKLGIVKGSKAARDLAESFCKSRDYDSIGWSGYCYDTRTGTISGTGVKIMKWVDYEPITSDEFFDESVSDADKKPDEWVETSEVKPTDEQKVKVPAGSVAQSDPYTDPKDRKVKQTRWDFDTGGRVREREIERPDLTPNSPEAPELKPPQIEETPPSDKDADKESASEPKAASAPADLCEKNPNILACDEQPEAPELEELPEIPTEEVNLRFQPDSVFPNAGQCPAPVSFQAMGATYQISTQPICDVAEKLRPLIIALAYLVAAFFVIRTIKSETA